jgi:3-methyl-2-oxobutanoate hydroxymethyltransferase
VLEKIPVELAREITKTISIPTIGIGAGPECDGQILVTHDMLGLFSRFRPRFVRRYAEMAASMEECFRKYCSDVRNRSFPSAAESYFREEA